MGIKNTIVKGFSLLKPLPLKDKIINYASLEVAVKGIFKEIKKKEPKITRTDVPENNSQKVFSALGALNLKNWLVTNYTTLMNNIRDNLTTLINGKLSHGGYGGTGQTLFNLIESAKTTLTSLINANKSKLENLDTRKANLSGAAFTGEVKAGLRNYLVIEDFYADVADTGTKIWRNANNLGYTSKSLFFDNTKDLYLNRHRVLTENNAGIKNKTLFSGLTSKGTTYTLSEPLYNFDFIQLLIGDDADISSIIYTPNQLISGYGTNKLIQGKYYDSNGGTSNNSSLDVVYYRFYENATTLQFMYGYTDNRYIPDSSASYITVIGFNFKTQGDN